MLSTVRFLIERAEANEKKLTTLNDGQAIYYSSHFNSFKELLLLCFFAIRNAIFNFNV